jgi:hypothetical protein
MTLYEWIKNEIDSEGYSSDCRLPDHADLGQDALDKWVPGAYESLLMRSTYSIRRHAIQNYLLARKVRAQAMRPSDKNQAKEEAALEKTGALAVVDPVISFLHAMHTDKNVLRREGLRLACETRKRELVKVGIALLGMWGNKDGGEDLEVLLTLARHEEFTFYCAPAVRSLMGAEKVNDHLLPLADKLDGWGKTAILYELNYDPALKDPDTGVQPASDYLLRRGCKNRLGADVNANICATKGGLMPKLKEISDSEELPDKELYTGICEIMWGLTEFGGVYDSINDYKYGHDTRNLFKQLVETRPGLAELDPRGPEIIERMR